MSAASGRFVIRMPAELHRKLREEAARAHQSLNRLCVSKLRVHSSVPTVECCCSHEWSGILSAELVDAILNRWRSEIVGLVLFGSAARGDATETSDTDLLLVMQPEAPISRESYRAWDALCRNLPASLEIDRVSPHFVRLPVSVRDAGSLWYEVSLDGIVLWEQERRVTRFLGSVRKAMGQGKIRRRMLHGSPYWVKCFEETDA